MRERRDSEPDAVAGGPTRILVLSASMGAGHDGAARELATRLRAEGHEAEVRDFLDSGPLRIGTALRCMIRSLARPRTRGILPLG